jgi:ABC-type lipoprotein export system ATPase subunit
MLKWSKRKGIADCADLTDFAHEDTGTQREPQISRISQAMQILPRLTATENREKMLDTD